MSLQEELRKALLDAKVVINAIVPLVELGEGTDEPLLMQIHSSDGLFALEEGMRSVDFFIKNAMENEDEMRFTIYVKRNQIIT